MMTMASVRDLAASSVGSEPTADEPSMPDEGQPQVGEEGWCLLCSLWDTSSCRVHVWTSGSGAGMHSMASPTRGSRRWGRRLPAAGSLGNGVLGSACICLGVD